MAYKFVKRNKIAVEVKGTLPDENGKPVKFDFKLFCKRKTSDEIEAVMKDRNSEVKNFVRDVAEGWDVLGEDNEPLLFSPENLNDVLNDVGMPTVIMQAYLSQIAATAKN